MRIAFLNPLAAGLLVSGSRCSAFGEPGQENQRAAADELNLAYSPSISASTPTSLPIIHLETSRFGPPKIA